MAARLAALLSRLLALTVIWLLATSTLTFASARRTIERQPEPKAKPAREQPKILVVPDVRRQVYVFAKGILEDGGFAWRVEGKVRGYAGNLVALQTPAPGLRVLDTGAPTVVLRLQRNPTYAERGLPENESPYEGSPLVLAPGEKLPAPAQASARRPARKPAKPAKPARPKTRKPDFSVPGAPPEPADEMPLPDRARLLGTRLAGRPRPTRPLVRYWLYQHAWVVTGARFGWSRGAEALRIVIRVDEDLQARWGIGARSAAVARAALAEVQAKAG